LGQVPSFLPLPASKTTIDTGRFADKLIGQLENQTVPKAQNRAVGIKWVSKAVLRKALDSRARRVLGVSGDVFEKQYAAKGPKSLDGKAGTVELATLCFFTKDRSAHKKSKRG
jgi:hypothetical protein